MAYLHANGGLMHYRAQGEGAPVLAVHGSASTGAQWRTLIGYLEGRFRVFSPDLPGCGASEPGTGGLAGDTAAVLALIDRIGEPVHLVGHSWGGAVALALARTRPDALRSLTVIEPSVLHLLRGGAPGDRALYHEIAAVACAVEGLAEAGAPSAAMGRFIDYWCGTGAWERTSPDLRAVLVRSLDRVRAEFRAAEAETWPLADLGRVAVPTLAVMGLNSPAVGMRITELVAETLPRAVLRLVPDAGHLAPLTDPHVVDPMITAHLVAADCARRLAPAIAA